MTQRKNMFKRQRFPREIILMAVRRFCRLGLSCRDVRDMLAERGVTNEIDFVTSLFPEAA